MADLYTDTEIADMLAEQKTLAAAIARPVSLSSRNGQRSAKFNADGAGDPPRHYRLIIRQAEDNPLDFSVIVGFCPNGHTSKKTFLLRRYNGKSHEHTNKIERETLAYTFHIHEATERYQQLTSGPARIREEGYAEVTDRYSTVEGALDCALEDCNFRIAPQPPTIPGQMSFTGGDDDDN